MREKGSFVGGAMVLLVSGIVVKLLGALFKIPLTNLIGDSGMGLFSFAMQFFSLLFVVAAAGLPIAESHLVSEALALGRRRHAQDIVLRAAGVFGLLAISLTAGLLVFARPICRLFDQPDAAPCVAAIAPAVFFVTIEAALRGWYQGTGNMIPTAISQVAEAAGKLTVGLLLAKGLLDAGCGISGAAMGAVLGVTCGELIAMLYLLWSARRGIGVLLHRSGKRDASTLPKLFRLMIPVTLGAAVMTVSGFLDMAVLYRRLPDAGFSGENIVAAYGAYTGMALTLFNLPQALSNSVSVSVLPALSAVHAKGNAAQLRRLTMTSMRLTLLVCLPCGAGLTALSGPLLRALFASQPRGVMTAEPLLCLLGFAEPLVGLSTVTTAILQSFGRPDLTVYSMTAGCIVKFIVSYVLTGLPQYNIQGAPYGTIVCYAVILLINMTCIVRLTHWRPPLGRPFVRLLAASVGTGACAYIIYDRLQAVCGGTAAMLAAVVAAIPVYLFLLCGLRALQAEDVAMLPGGERMAQLLRLSN